MSEKEPTTVYLTPALRQWLDCQVAARILAGAPRGERSLSTVIADVLAAVMEDQAPSGYPAKEQVA